MGNRHTRTTSVIIKLAEFISKRTTRQYAPSINVISRELNIDRRTVAKYAKLLVQLSKYLPVFEHKIGRAKRYSQADYFYDSLIRDTDRRQTYGEEPIELDPIETEGWILDIGGGEGIIGKLSGKQVITIDVREAALAKNQNQTIKILMSASKLQFLSDSFDVCTSFFFFMHTPQYEHSRVFEEVHRVLKPGGRFLLWDIMMRKNHGNYKILELPLEVKLPSERIYVKYMAKRQGQNIEYFKELAGKARFQIDEICGVGRPSRWHGKIVHDIFRLEMSKPM